MYYNIKPGDIVTRIDSDGVLTVERIEWNHKNPAQTVARCRYRGSTNWVVIRLDRLNALARRKKQAKPPSEIKLRDIVRVKHPGWPADLPTPPDMCVVETRWLAHNPDESDVLCEWWAPDGLQHKQYFGWNQLEVVQSPKPTGLFKVNDVVAFKDAARTVCFYDVVATETDLRFWSQNVTVRRRLDGNTETVQGDRLRLVEAAKPMLTIGDVVRLKSGGPRMTIETFANGHAQCAYHDADGCLKYAYFHLEMLEKA